MNKGGLVKAPPYVISGGASLKMLLSSTTDTNPCSSLSKLVMIGRVRCLLKRLPVLGLGLDAADDCPRDTDAVSLRNSSTAKLGEHPFYQSVLQTMSTN
jgi:hypothetical protein